MTPRRGEVYWVTFVDPIGRRPVVVVQNDVGNRYSPTTIVADISNAPRRPYPFLVPLDASELGRQSWVHCETLNTILSDTLEERLATLSAAAMDAVDEALRHSLGLG